MPETDAEAGMREQRDSLAALLKGPSDSLGDCGGTDNIWTIWSVILC